MTENQQPQFEKVKAILDKISIASAIEIYHEIGVWLHDKIESKQQDLETLKTNFPMFETGAPLVESISGYRIVKLGFVKAETTILPETQTVQTVYRRGDDIIAYNGYKWF